MKRWGSLFFAAVLMLVSACAGAVIGEAKGIGGSLFELRASVALALPPQAMLAEMATAAEQQVVPASGMVDVWAVYYPDNDGNFVALATPALETYQVDLATYMEMPILEEYVLGEQVLRAYYSMAPAMIYAETADVGAARQAWSKLYIINDDAAGEVVVEFRYVIPSYLT